ncbi:MAG: hypothetical protein ACOH2M_26910 [Cypionkella sp.]
MSAEKSFLVIVSEAAADLPSGHGSDAAMAYADLSLEALTQLGATAVVCHLFAGRIDAMMVLNRLAHIGYQGRCIVLCPSLPRRDLVQSELQAEAAGILIELIEVAQDQRLS